VRTLRYVIVKCEERKERRGKDERKRGGEKMRELKFVTIHSI
jgi:hypothetical protein